MKTTKLSKIQFSMMYSQSFANLGTTVVLGLAENTNSQTIAETVFSDVSSYLETKGLKFSLFQKAKLQGEVKSFVSQIRDVYAIDGILELFSNEENHQELFNMVTKHSVEYSQL